MVRGMIMVVGAVGIDMVAMRERFLDGTSNPSDIRVGLGGVGYRIFSNLDAPRRYVTALAADPITRWAREALEAELKATFRPEFLNRVDEIIVFNPLTKELLKRIVGIQADRMKKYIKEKNVDIKLTDAAKEYFADIGFDPIYGARPLKRALQREILNILAMKILDKTFREGDTVEVDYKSDKLTFKKLPAAKAAA
jgi:ATP-dependent Clp protease ATP-binding subunit ClpA